MWSLVSTHPWVFAVLAIAACVVVFGKFGNSQNWR